MSATTPSRARSSAEDDHVGLRTSRYRAVDGTYCALRMGP
jgi:hypothetical protein